MSAAPAVISSKDVISVTPNGETHPTSTKMVNGDTSSSSDEINPRIRKPYTITKQREKWTQQEHQKFLEALKLYGRSWRDIKEYIGTKTTIQIRSHAQKFFVKVEKGISNTGLNGGIQEIAIPPPRPKRKPIHPYPRKAGSSSTLTDRNGDTLSDYASAVEPPVISGPLHSNGLPAQGNNLPGTASGGHEFRYLKQTESIAAKGDKVVLLDDGKFENAPCIEKDLLSQPQIDIYDGSKVRSRESPDLPFEVNPSLPASCEIESTGCEPRIQAESENAHPPEQESRPLAQNNTRTSDAEPKACEQRFIHTSNPASTVVNSLVNCYGGLPASGRSQFSLAVPTHEHSPYLIPPWQFMQAHFMNHPAAFAAAMAAATLSMTGTASASPYACRSYSENQLLSPGDLNVAAFAAASASWWALSGFAPTPFSHHAANPLTFQQLQMQMQSVAQQGVHAEPYPPEKETKAVPSSSPKAYKAEEKVFPECYNPKKANPGAISLSSSPDMAEKHESSAAAELHEGDLTTGEGSSSGSNTPALLSNSSEQDIPSVSENDNEENKVLCIPLDDTHRTAFQALGGNGFTKLKARAGERGRSQYKEFRNGEHENGKRLKSIHHHEIDSRKEVSSQGRKAFQALFSCRRLPQTFDREPDRSDIVLLKEKINPHTVFVQMKDSDTCQDFRALWSSECALLTESKEPNPSYSHARSTTTDVDTSGTCSSLRNEPRAGMSGFIPYQKSTAKSRASLDPARAAS